MEGWTISNWKKQSYLKTALHALIAIFILVDKVFLNVIFIDHQPFLSVEREINEVGVYAKEHVQSKVLVEAYIFRILRCRKLLLGLDVTLNTVEVSAGN